MDEMNRASVTEKVIWQVNYATVMYDSSRQIGKIVWSGHPKDSEYRIPFEKMLEFARVTPVRRFLSDTRYQGVVSVDNRKWFEKEMFPQAIEAGLQRAAAISDGNAFKRYYINMIISSINKFGVPLKIFGDEESAISFLLEE